MRRPTVALSLLLVAAACGVPAPGGPSSPATASTEPGGPSAPSASGSGAPATSATSQHPAEPPGVTFLHDDFTGAVAQAAREGKAVFVDVWAPWCHTCLSMKHEVLDQPSLRDYAERVVFVALDSDRPENEAFVEQYAVDVWPTFFMVDPAGAKVVGYWPGAASLPELRAFLDDGLAQVAATGGAGAKDPLLLRLAEARGAMARRDLRTAARVVEALVRDAPASWPRRSEALILWLRSLAKTGQQKRCAEVGLRHLDEVRGAALPADFVGGVLACGAALPPPQRSALRRRCIARLRAVVDRADAGMTPDDRADALSMMAGALADEGDAAGAQRALEERVAVMEAAAAAAPDAAHAQTHDYGRANAYLALGRGAEAVALLTARCRELPESYEAAARLASVLYRLKRHEEALAAVQRAVEKSYGQRRLSYLSLQARIQEARGDVAGQIEALALEVQGWEALGAERNAADLADARARHAAAVKKRDAAAAPR